MENNQNKKFNGSLIYAIVGVMALIVAVSGSAYAYYQASATNSTAVTGTAGGGSAPTLTVTKASTGATGNLIPIDMTTAMLTKAAKGWNPTLNSNQGGVGTSWNATYACKDKNSYTVCQIYSVTVKNNSTVPVGYTIKLTSLSGTSTPNIDAVTMASNISVTSATSIKSNGTICTTDSVAAGGTSTACYFMVFIKNLNSAQTDSGSFAGTVTATGSNGDQIYARFS